MRPVELAGKIGQDKADALTAYLRRHPDAVGQQTGSLSLARGGLAESLATYRAGDRQRAGELALSAYLDGFEPIEPTLTARDRTLMERIEGAMGEYRAAIQSGENADALSDRLQVLDDLLDGPRRWRCRLTRQATSRRSSARPRSCCARDWKRYSSSLR
jgi:high-affinity iron transporter